MTETPAKPKPLTPAQVEARVRELLASAQDDAALRGAFEELARERLFSGFTWLWGPALYRRNRVVFRPFILSHFGEWQLTPGILGTARDVQWTGEVGKTLEAWLAEVDRRNDVPLFRLLFRWRINSQQRGKWDWEAVQKAYREELLARFSQAHTRVARDQVLAKMDSSYRLDEPTAVILYETEPQAVTKFILSHLPFYWSWMGDESRQLWTRLHQLAEARGDHDFAWALYRRQVPIAQWTKDVVALCDWHRDPAELLAALDRHHPEGYGLDLGTTFYRLVEMRGTDVFPYVSKHLRDVWARTWRRGGYEQMLDLSYRREWWGLWGALVRICAQPEQYNTLVRGLLDNRKLPETEVRGRLLMLAGVSREWNFPGLGIAQVQAFEPATAVKCYERFPELLRGPFKLNVSLTWHQSYRPLVARLIEQGEEELVDFIASRAVTHGWLKNRPDLAAVVEQLVTYYEAMREEPERFAQRASRVLGQVPAFSIYTYGPLVRENRLARLLFERSNASFLADPVGLQDLVEAAEIHVQALAYRTLGLDDDRARAGAAAALDIIIGTLLRPLHRQTRILAFGALANAAHTKEHAARILARAREALVLPDQDYPKDKLVGLIARLLRRWPELRTPAEQPVIYGETAP